MTGVFVKKVAPPPISKKEILRYAGALAAGGELSELLDSALHEAQSVFTYKACYALCDVQISDGVCDFGAFSVESCDLSKNLSGANRAVIFAATVGIGIDRLIAKYARLSPARALILQAIGAERIEALCDGFCNELRDEMGVGFRPRFSAGYGDLPIEAQRDIFKILDAPRKIGLSLNDSMLMTPTKSVTAFMGII